MLLSNPNLSGIKVEKVDTKDKTSAERDLTCNFPIQSSKALSKGRQTNRRKVQKVHLFP